MPWSEPSSTVVARHVGQDGSQLRDMLRVRPVILGGHQHDRPLIALGGGGHVRAAQGQRRGDGDDGIHGRIDGAGTDQRRGGAERRPDEHDPLRPSLPQRGHDGIEVVGQQRDLVARSPARPPAPQVVRGDGHAEVGEGRYDVHPVAHILTGTVDEDDGGLALAHDRSPDRDTVRGGHGQASHAVRDVLVRALLGHRHRGVDAGSASVASGFPPAVGERTERGDQHDDRTRRSGPEPAPCPRSTGHPRSV